MSRLHDGFTPKMRPVSPRRSAVVAGLDIGTSKIVCLIARLTPQGPQDTLRRRSHGIEILGIGHTESRGMHAGAVFNLSPMVTSPARFRPAAIIRFATGVSCCTRCRSATLLTACMAWASRAACWRVSSASICTW